MPRIQWDPKVTFGNVLTAIAMLAAVLGVYVNLKIEVQAARSEVAAVQEQVQPVDDLKTRMVLVERNQVTGREQREAFQDAMTISVDELRKQNLAILTQLAAISARLDERDRRPP